MRITPDRPEREPQPSAPASGERMPAGESRVPQLPLADEHENHIISDVDRWLADVVRDDADAYEESRRLWDILAGQVQGGDGQIDLERLHQYAPTMEALATGQLSVAPESERTLLWQRLAVLGEVVERPLILGGTGYEQTASRLAEIFAESDAGPSDAGDVPQRPGSGPEREENVAPKTTAGDVEPPGPPRPPAPPGPPGPVGPQEEPPDDSSLQTATARWFRDVRPAETAAKGIADAQPALHNPIDLARRGVELALRHADEIVAPLGRSSRSHEPPQARTDETLRALSAVQVDSVLDQVDEHGAQLIDVLETIRNQVIPVVEPDEWQETAPSAFTRTAAAMTQVDDAINALRRAPHELPETAQPSMASSFESESERKFSASIWSGVVLGLDRQLASVRHLATQAAGGDPTAEEVAQAAQGLGKYEEIEFFDRRIPDAVGSAKLFPILIDRSRAPGLADSAPRLVFVPEELASGDRPEYSVAQQRHHAITAVEWVTGLARQRYQAALENERAEDSVDQEVANRLGRTALSISDAQEALRQTGRAIAESEDSVAGLDAAWQPLRDYRDQLFTVELAGTDPRTYRVELNLPNSDPLEVTSELLGAIRRLDDLSGGASPSRGEVVSLLARSVAAAGTQLVEQNAYRGELAGTELDELNIRINDFITMSGRAQGHLAGAGVPSSERVDSALAKLNELITYQNEQLDRQLLAHEGEPQEPRVLLAVADVAVAEAHIEELRRQAFHDPRSQEEISRSPYTDVALSGAAKQGVVLEKAVSIVEDLRRLSRQVILPFATAETELRVWDAAEALGEWSAELTAMIKRHRSWEASGDITKWESIAVDWPQVLSSARSRAALAPVHALRLAAEGKSPQGLEAAFGGQERFILTPGDRPGRRVQYQVAAETEYQPLLFHTNGSTEIVLVPTKTVDENVNPQEFIEQGLSLAMAVIREELVDFDHNLHEVTRGLFERGQAGSTEYFSRWRGVGEPTSDDEMITKLGERYTEQRDARAASRDALLVLEEVQLNPNEEIFELLRVHNDQLCSSNFELVGTDNVPDVSERRITTKFPDPVNIASLCSHALGEMYGAGRECGDRNAAAMLAIAVPLAAAAGQRLIDEPGPRLKEVEFTTKAAEVLDFVDQLDEQQFAKLGPDRVARLGLIIEVLRYQYEHFRDDDGPSGGNAIGRGPQWPAAPGSSPSPHNGPMAPGGSHPPNPRRPR